MSWEFQPDRPIYSQLSELISQKIICGEYPPGYRLPSVRDMADRAGVNPNTMQRALSDLEKTGLIRTERTSGRFVTEDQNLLQKTKTELAFQIIREFFRQMLVLGIDPEQAMTLAKQYELSKEMR